MVNGRGRDRRNSTKKTPGETLPPDWEVRHPRGGGSEIYYYNTTTHESTWVRPTLTPSKDSRGQSERANGISRQSDEGSRARSPHPSPPENKAEPSPIQQMSFDDRHYRPVEVPTSTSRVEHTLPQKPVFVDRRSPERSSPAENNRHTHRPQGEPERARSRRGASPSNIRPPSPGDRRQETGRESRARSSRMDSYVPSADRTHTSTHDERGNVRPSTNRRPATARDSPYGQETRSDYDSYVPGEGDHPRSRRSRRSRSTSPRSSRTKDTGAEEVARRDSTGRRRPRDPETDVVTNEVESKRRRLDSLRDSDRPSPSSTPQHSSTEKNESLHGPPGESRQKRPPLPPQKSLYKESMNSHAREPPPTQYPEPNDPIPRRNGHRPDPAGRPRNLEPQPPSGPGGRRARTDSRKLPRTEQMDVDSPISIHPQKMQENRSSSNVVSDRDDSRGDLPRGPKAMTSKLPSLPPTSLPPKPTMLSDRYTGRSPPPHLIGREENLPQRPGDRSIVDSHSDRHRDTSTEHRNSEVVPSRRRSPDSRQPPTESTPIPKLSGTNNVPIVRSRYQATATSIPGGVDEHRRDHGSENKQSLPNISARQARHERSAIPERVQTNPHELPDRPPAHQGPLVPERRESNRPRHEPLDRRAPHNLRAESHPEGSGTRRNQLPPGAKVIYERPSPPLSPRHERDLLEPPAENRTKSDARRRGTTRLPESQAMSDHMEHTRVDHERALRQEDRQRTRNDGSDEGRSRLDAVDYPASLERRFSSYERQSYSPNELPPQSPPSQVSCREDYDAGTSGYDERNYGRGSERAKTPSPSRNHNFSQSRGPRTYGDGGDSRRLPARPRSPHSDIGERSYGKREPRSTMSSWGGSLLDRLDNQTSDRDVEKFDDRAAVMDVSMTSNGTGQESAGERRDNGRRRRRAKGSRR